MAQILKYLGLLCITAIQYHILYLVLDVHYLIRIVYGIGVCCRPLFLTPFVFCFRPVDEERLRPVTQLDLLFGLDKMKESKRATASMLPSVSEVPLD